MHVLFPGATWFETVAIREDGFGYPGDPHVFVSWASITRVGAVRETDIVALEDVFFWALICQPAENHMWLPMPVDAGEFSGAHSAFESQLKARGFVCSLPPVSDWHVTGLGYDRSYLSFCTFPTHSYGQPVYEYRRPAGLFSRPRLHTVITPPSHAA